MSKFNGKKLSKIQLAPKRKISFSFLHLTTQKNYNLDYFKSDLRNTLNAYKGLLQAMQDISQKTWSELLMLKKEQYLGTESIPFNAINFSPHGLCISKDTKIFVIRFGDENSSQKYRLLGYKPDTEDVLYIIGFDFNYKAYNHG